MMDHIAHIYETDETDIQKNFRPIGNKLHYKSEKSWMIFKGSSSTNVFFGFFEKTTPVAVKRIVRNADDDLLHEAKLLLQMDGHPNILRYYCTEINDDFIFIATEICDGTLEDLVNGSYGGPSIGNDREVLLQVTQGVYYLHQRGIIHRDIKPINIFISQHYGTTVKPTMKIADFGLCRNIQNNNKKFKKSSNNPAGTEGWMAPECITVDYIDDEKVDVFSLGCIYGYTLSGGMHPFEGDHVLQRQVNINQRKPMSLTKEQLKPMYSRDPFVFKLICCMLEMDPNDRPTVRAILGNDFFTRTYPGFFQKVFNLMLQ